VNLYTKKKPIGFFVLSLSYIKRYHGNRRVGTYMYISYKMCTKGLDTV